MDIEEKVKYLLDRFEIQDVIVKYSFGQDMHQGENNNLIETWKDVFTADAILDYSAAGAPAAASYVEMIKIMRGDGTKPGNMNGFTNWQHLTGNPVVIVNGENASARTDMWMTHKGKADSNKQPQSLYVAGAFTDKLTRTDKGWKISFRKLELHFMDMIKTIPINEWT